VGNRLRGDDAAGPALVDALAGASGIHCIDAGTTPENYGRKIADLSPDVVLLVDAAIIGRRPGEYEVLRKEEIADSGLTTHTASPGLFIGFLEQCTAAPVYLVAIQPEVVSFGEGLSQSVAEAVDGLAHAIMSSHAV
jgi:hydrogenase 3 maturation protease